jgi:hypothetical protein
MDRFGWRNMEKSYFVATNLKHDREQLAGKLRNLRKIWRFCNLARESTGLGIDAKGYI